MQQEKVTPLRVALRIMVEAKKSLLRSAGWKLLKDNNYN